MNPNSANTFVSALLLCVFLLMPGELQAAKTDLVYLHNGDRVTGEIKSLHRGKLEFKTDTMGTIYIEWNDIQEIVSDIGQSVELTNGHRFYGPLEKPPEDDMLKIHTEQGEVAVGTADVIGLYPVESSFWDRLDVSASVGLSWDKASEVGKYNIGLDAEYRNPRFITTAGFSTEVTTQSGRDDTTRANANLAHMVFRPNKRFHTVFGQLEHNDELGIDLRALGGIGYGMVPIRSQRNWFSVAWGAAINHETPTVGMAETNLEAVGMMTYDYFKYSSPQRRFKTDFVVFPSITDFGRVRATFDTEFSIEFVPDLFWKLDFYASWDSDPVSEEASTIDYGVISSLAYKF